MDAIGSCGHLAIGEEPGGILERCSLPVTRACLRARIDEEGIAGSD